MIVTANRTFAEKDNQFVFQTKKSKIKLRIQKKKKKRVAD